MVWFPRGCAQCTNAESPIEEFSWHRADGSRPVEAFLLAKSNRGVSLGNQLIEAFLSTASGGVSPGERPIEAFLLALLMEAFLSAKVQSRRFSWQPSWWQQAGRGVSPGNARSRVFSPAHPCVVFACALLVTVGTVVFHTVSDGGGVLEGIVPEL
jgi:hypothetical protein